MLLKLNENSELQQLLNDGKSKEFEIMFLNKIKYCSSSINDTIVANDETKIQILSEINEYLTAKSDYLSDLVIIEIVKMVCEIESCS